MAVARSTFFLFLWTVIALILFAAIRYQHLHAGWVPPIFTVGLFRSLLTARHSYAPGYPRKPRCENQRQTREVDSCQFRCPGGSCEAKEICDKRDQCVTKFECDCNKKPPAVPIHSKWCTHNKFHYAWGVCADQCAYGTCVLNRYFGCAPPKSCWDLYRCDCDKKPLIMGCFHGQDYSRFDQCDIYCDGGTCEGNYDYCDELGCPLRYKCNCSKKPKYEGIWWALAGV